jgi:branched-chain amino acid transport system substrate-binding protein
VALIDLFSGPDGSAGPAMRNGLELEAAGLNAGGGLLGSRIEIVAADAAGDPARAAALVREQVGGAGVALVVGPDTTAGFQAARASLDGAGVPNCLTGVADGALRGAGATFLAGPANSAEVGALLDAVRRARPDVRKIGLLDEGDELGASYDAQLASRAPGAGLSYVGRASAGESGDQRAALQQLAARGAQVVVVSERPLGAARAAAADAQLDAAARPQLAGFAALADYGFASLGGDAAAGALVVATPQAYLTSAPQARWPAGYRAFVAAAGQQYGFGEQGAQLQAAPAAADCLLQWADAARSAGTFAGAAVASAWERLDLPASATALGVEERPTPADHATVAQPSLRAYRWTRAGTRYQLQPV